MVKTGSSPFSARVAFQFLADEVERGQSVVCYIRPHPEDEGSIEIARPGKEDEWLAVHEDVVEDFDLLAFRSPVHADCHLVRLRFRPDADWQGMTAVERLLNSGRLAADDHGGGPFKSVLTEGAQYCYYDAKGRYVCIPI